MPWMVRLYLAGSISGSLEWACMKWSDAGVMMPTDSPTGVYKVVWVMLRVIPRPAGAAKGEGSPWECVSLGCA